MALLANLNFLIFDRGPVVKLINRIKLSVISVIFIASANCQTTPNGMCPNDYSISYTPTTSLKFKIFNYSGLEAKVSFRGQMASCVYNSNEEVCTKQLATNEADPLHDTIINPIPNGDKNGTMLPTIKSYGSCNIPGAINLSISDQNNKQLSFRLMSITYGTSGISTYNYAYLTNASQDTDYQFDVYLMYYNSIYKTENFGTNLITYIANEQKDGGFIQNLDNKGLRDFEIYICKHGIDPANPDPNSCNIPARQKV